MHILVNHKEAFSAYYNSGHGPSFSQGRAWQLRSKGLLGVWVARPKGEFGRSEERAMLEAVPMVWIGEFERPMMETAPMVGSGEFAMPKDKVWLVEPMLLGWIGA
jgi:hypothetical protein